MTPGEVAEFCRSNGQEVPPAVRAALDRGPEVPRSSMSLDFGGLYGRAVLTVEFDATSAGPWGRWLSRLRDGGEGRRAMGGVLSDARPV